MKSQKITLSLMAGLILLQPQQLWPNMLTENQQSQAICEKPEQKTSWLSRHKGKIIGATLLIAGFYCGVKVHAMLPTAEEMKKLNEAAKKLTKTAAIQGARLERHLDGANLELQAKILTDFAEHTEKMGEIILREATGESCRTARAALWCDKRWTFLKRGVEKLWDKATDKD